MVFESLFTFLSKIMFFTSFVNESGSFPKPLSPEEEADRLRLAQSGDKESKDILVRHNLRLVAHIVKKYNGAAEVDDMISVGTIGLMKAIINYSYGKGTQLATYAARCIENEILMYIRANKKHKNTASLLDTVGTDREGNEVTLMDILCIKEENVLEQVETNILLEKVLSVIKNSLQGREYDIICMRYGIGQPALTQREVAQLLGISRSYISRIEKKAIEKVRNELI